MENNTDSIGVFHKLLSLTIRFSSLCGFLAICKSFPVCILLLRLQDKVNHKLVQWIEVLPSNYENFFSILYIAWDHRVLHFLLIFQLSNVGKSHIVKGTMIALASTTVACLQITILSLIRSHLYSCSLQIDSSEFTTCL